MLRNPGWMYWEKMHPSQKYSGVTRTYGELLVRYPAPHIGESTDLVDFSGLATAPALFRGLRYNRTGAGASDAQFSAAVVRYVPSIHEATASCALKFYQKYQATILVVQS